MLLAAGMILAFCACDISPSSPPPSSPGATINSEEPHLQFYLEGKGAPAVVIDVGLGDQMDNLRSLQELLAQETQVFVYNRAGYGESEPGPYPRHPDRVAEELKALLEQTQVAGPYLLVGHSLGALNMQVFAAKYPGDVAGLVLLDPPPLDFIQGNKYESFRTMAEGMTEEWEALADSLANSDDPQEQAQSAFFATIASEHREMFGESAKQLGAISTFGELPLVVLAAEIPNPEFGELADEFQQFWIEQNRARAELSTKGKFILAEGATHHIYTDAPELGVESILAVIKQVRSK